MQPQTSPDSVPPVAPAPTPAAGMPPVPPLPGVGTPAASMPHAPMPTPAAAPAPAKSAELVTPEIADDGDLIEKEWVAKVKQVVAKTTGDPYELNRQFMQLKSDYMQKRYGKSLKLDD